MPRETQPAARRRPPRSQTRRQLLDAAITVFARKGIAATSLADIATEAGLTKGAVYSNFDSKDALVLALMAEHIVARMRHATEVFDGVSDTGEAVREAGARLHQGVLADATWHRLFLEYWTLAMRDADVHSGLTERRRELRAAIAAAIARAAQAQRVDLAITADELAVTMLALSNGLAVERGIDQSAVPDELFANLLALLVRV